MYKYVVIVEKAENNYSAYSPDIPGCVATGKTIEETLERMKEAIEFHIESLKIEGLNIPKPSSTVATVEVVT